jgi:hypothetical protein
MDSLSQVLKKILSLNPDLGKGIHEARILELWPLAIGESISKHARAVQIKGTTLFISVEKPVWRQELHSNKTLVLQKLNRYLIENLGAPSRGDLWIADIFFLGSQSPTTSSRPKAGKPFPKK